MVIVELPMVSPLKVGQEVALLGKDPSYGVIQALFWPRPGYQAQGELSYAWAMDKPFPQILVKDMQGQTRRYDGADLLGGRVELANIPELAKPRFLSGWLAIKFLDFEHGGEGGFSIHDLLTDRQKAVLQPLYGDMAYAWVHDSDSDDPSTMLVGEGYGPVGEFDEISFAFQSVDEGSMMCNDGIAAWILGISVHGYEKPSIAFTTSRWF